MSFNGTSASEMAVRRIAEAQKQVALFPHEPTPKAEQLGLIE